jgi:hypothetical protein
VTTKEDDIFFGQVVLVDDVVISNFEEWFTINSTITCVINRSWKSFGLVGITCNAIFTCFLFSLSNA